MKQKAKIGQRILFENIDWRKKVTISSLFSQKIVNQVYFSLVKDSLNFYGITFILIISYLP